MTKKNYFKTKPKEFEEQKRLLLTESQREADDMRQSQISVSSVSNGISIMRFPLFSSKDSSTLHGRQQEGISYQNPNNGISFVVTPNPQFGMPDQVDANFLRLIVSKIREVHLSKGVCPSSIYLSRYEMINDLDLTYDENCYKVLNQILDRIASTHYKGNIFYKDKIFTGALFSFEYPNDEDPNGIIRIMLNEKFKDYLDHDKSVLVIPSDIMKLRSPLEIRVKELVQLNIGKKNSWSIGLEKLCKLCHVKTPLKEFKSTLSNLSSIPYFVSFAGSRRLLDQIVKFDIKERQPDSIAPIIGALTSNVTKSS